MSKNKNMHPRNIYKTPPDYTALAIKYPEFRKMCTLQLDGKVSINLKAENTLKVLSQTLLKNDFGLDVKFPDNCLVPTVPLRLNYILWIEDILKEFDLTNVHGIDIGCGAICIYCLLASKKNNWKMTGIETQLESIQYAIENIKNNKLDHQINVFHQRNTEAIFNKLFYVHDEDVKDSKIYDFCICNPPFYDSQTENLNNIINNQQSRKRKMPNNLATGNQMELMCDGGEETFVKKIIMESLKYKTNIRIYSSMVGHKKSVGIILSLLEKKGISNIIQTEFCQGNTTRWGIAWTFHEIYDLKKCQKYCINTKLSCNK